MGGDLERAYNIIRLVILFALGIVLIWDAAFGPGDVDLVIELTVGLILIGVIPVDVIMDRLTKK
jgi:hypothetical protein